MIDNSKSTQAKASTFERNILTTAKGGSVLAAGNLFEIGGRFFIVFLLARLLGAEEYGLYNLALTAATLIASISLLGMDTALIRYVAILTSRRDEARLWGALQIGIGVAVSVSTLMGLGLFILAQPIAERLFHEPKLIPLLQVLSLIVPFLTLSEVLVGVAYGFKKMEYSAIAQNFIQLLVRLFLIGVLALVGLNAVGVALIFGLSDVAASVALIYLLNREFSWRRPLQSARHEVREISSFALPLWLSDLMKKFKNNIQTILLGTMSTVTNVGIFSLAGKLNLLSHIFYSSMITSVKPVLAELYAREDWEQMGHLYQTATRWTLMLNLPMFLILILFSESILSIFGQSFVSGATVMVILAWADLINAATGVCGSVLDMTGAVKVKLFNSVLWIFLGVGINFILIPRWGLTGAAMAVFIGITTINLVRVLEVWILFRLFPYNLSFIKPVTAALVALGMTLWIGRWFPAEGSLLYTVIGGATILLVYASVILLLGLTSEDRAVLARMSQRAGSLFIRSRRGTARYLSAK